MERYLPVGMAVDSRRLAMGSPAGMSNASMGVIDLGEVGLGLCNQLLQLGDFAHLLEGKDLILLVAVNSETGRVVATVFQTRQALFLLDQDTKLMGRSKHTVDQGVENELAVLLHQVVDVSEDATEGQSVWDWQL